MSTIPKGHPVAVVYYRYDRAVTPPVHGGFYYVHNGFAATELTIGDGFEAVISHVPRWSSTLTPELENVTFCAQGDAQDADANPSKYSKKNYRWEEDKAADNPKRIADTKPRLWVSSVVQPYSDGLRDVEHHQPITWVETKNLGHPNNGAFEAFEAPEHKGGGYVIHYWDWRNTHVDGTKGESPRTATDPKKFHLTQGQEDKTNANMAVVSCGPEWVHLDITWH